MANDLTVNILGFAAANRDLKVELRDPLTQGVVRTVTPFLDGTVRIPKIAAGAYELTVTHPNVVLPVIRRPIRVLPTGNTKVSVLIDPSKFRNTPIEDIPEANLGPVSDMAQSIAETVTPLGAKVPGEAILAQDWNTMAGAIRDLSNTMGEMAKLVSPTGHDHPELVAKLDEMTNNFQTLLESITQALTELQRQIQTLSFRRQVEDLLDRAEISPASPKGREFTDLVENLERNVAETPTAFSRATRNAAVQLQTKLETLMTERAADPEFAVSEPVKSVASAIDLLKQQRTTTYGGELAHNLKVDRTLGGTAFKAFRK